MNILPIVITFLMLISILTYSRLQVFYSSVVSKSSFTHYMNDYEARPLNIASNREYDLEADEGEPQGKQNKSEAASKVNWKVIIEGKGKRYQEYFDLSVDLIQKVYAEHPGVQELLKERPTAIQELLSDLKEKKVKYFGDLSNLTLQDSQLNELLYNLLKGYNDLHKNEISLRKFFTLSKYENIRIYLASSSLLSILYGDASVANEIIIYRKQLYRQVMSGVKKPEEATAEFTHLFQMRAARIDHKYLNFDVTKTNPGQYE